LGVLVTVRDWRTMRVVYWVNVSESSSANSRGLSWINGCVVYRRDRGDVPVPSGRGRLRRRSVVSRSVSVSSASWRRQSQPQRDSVDAGPHPTPVQSRRQISLYRCQ